MMEKLFSVDAKKEELLIFIYQFVMVKHALQLHQLCNKLLKELNIHPNYFIKMEFSSFWIITMTDLPYTMELLESIRSVLT